jgi:hypothetical protein
MPLVSNSFDLQSVEWRRITDPTSKAFRVDFEYSLLGYDLDSQRLDMLLRYGEGGHCRRHRHVAATVTLVLEGEQFLEEMLPDGGTRSIHRTKGTYALAKADAHPHDEYGGEHGGTVLLSMTAADDGVLFEYFDEQMENSWTVSIREFVDSWMAGAAYGVGPVTSQDDGHENLTESTLVYATGQATHTEALQSVRLKQIQDRDEVPSSLSIRESQEVSADGRVLDFSNSRTASEETSSSSRFNSQQARENKKNRKIGLGLGILIFAMLGLAAYLMMAAYDRTLPPSNRGLGEMTRPSMR